MSAATADDLLTAEAKLQSARELLATDRSVSEANHRYAAEQIRQAVAVLIVSWATNP